MKPLANGSRKYDKRTITTLVKGHWGATGLETAIILVAFAVVASVFAFTVLSSGIFSPGRGRETTQAGPLVLVGPVLANSVADKNLAQGRATSLVVVLAIAPRGKPVDLTEPVDADHDGLSDSDSTHTLIVTYTDANQVVEDVYWTRAFIAEYDGDNLLETGEKVQLTVTLKSLEKANPPVKGTEFQLELRAGDSGALVIERTMPDTIDSVMNLN